LFLLYKGITAITMPKRPAFQIGGPGGRELSIILREGIYQFNNEIGTAVQWKRGIIMADWKQALDDAITSNTNTMKANKEGINAMQEAAEHFYADTIMPTLQEFKAEVEKHGFTADANGSGVNASIRATKDNEQVLRYEVRSQITPTGTVLSPFKHHIDEKGAAFQTYGSYQNGNIKDFTKEELLNDLTQAMKDGLYSLSRRQR
ncbi:MAG: hypothetical protein ACRYFS_21795, partial [Janthinobacterium lividum]